MKKPSLSKKIVAAIVALLAAVAGMYGYNVSQPVQDAAVESACSTVVDCQE